MDHVAYQQALRERVGLRDLPFEDAEYRARQDRVRRRMDAAGLDLLLVSDPSDICYLTGYNTFEVSVHTVAVLGAERCVLQVPSIETGPAVTGSLVDEVLGYRWEGADTIVEQLARAALDVAGGSPAGVLGLDLWSPSLRGGVVEGLRQRLASWRLTDGSGLVDAERIVKSEPELAMLRESARVTALGLDAAAAVVRPGVTDSQVAAAGAGAMLAAGSEFMSMQPIVSTGWRSSVIHTSHRRQRVAAGDPVFMEFGAAWQRYTAPLMRTVVAGAPTPAMEALFEALQAIHAALAQAMRPGNRFHDAAVAAEAAWSALHDQAFFSGVYGYSVGAQFPPSWVEGSGYIARGQDTEFQENMVFHLPLCLRRPGEWGLGCSETVRVTANGGEPLTANRWSLAAG